MYDCEARCNKRSKSSTDKTRVRADYLDVSDEGLHDPLPLLLAHEVQAGQLLLLKNWKSCTGIE